MTLLMITLVAVFLAGLSIGALALVVIGIHVEERHGAEAAESRTATASRRLLATGLARDDGRR